MYVGTTATTVPTGMGIMAAHLAFKNCFDLGPIALTKHYSRTKGTATYFYSSINLRFKISYISYFYKK